MKKKITKPAATHPRRAPRKGKATPPLRLPAAPRERGERGEPYLPGGESWDEIVWLDKVA